MEIPVRIKRLFWDVDRDSIDIEKHKFYIIKRIIEYGDLEDVSWMKNTYSEDEIAEVIKKSKGLSRKTAYFWAYYLNIPLEEIECLKK